MQSLNPRLAAGQPPHLADKAIISSGVENARCVAGEMQSSSIATPLDPGNLLRHLCRRSTPPCPAWHPG